MKNSEVLTIPENRDTIIAFAEAYLEFWEKNQEIFNKLNDAEFKAECLRLFTDVSEFLKKSRSGSVKYEGFLDLGARCRKALEVLEPENEVLKNS